MKHLTGSGKSGRIGTWLIVVAAALIVLAAAVQMAKACVNCTPGGQCEDCFERAAFLYGEEDNPRPTCTGVCSMGDTGDDARTRVPLKFECRAGVKKDSKTYDQVILHWGMSVDDTGAFESTKEFTRCFERERKSGGTESAVGTGPAATIASTKSESSDEYYVPVPNTPDTTDNTYQTLTNNGVKIAVILYKRYTMSGSDLARVRTTEVTFDTDNGEARGAPRFKTWIHGYWVDNEDENKNGKLWYVVKPEGVVRYLQSTGHTTEGGISAADIPTDADSVDSYPNMDDGLSWPPAMRRG